MNQTIPVIIDTDIGDDIDDAFALCLAMQSPEIRLLGVTTVFKNTVCRAKIAKRLLELGEFPDVPVHAGASVPLGNEIMFGKAIDYQERPRTYDDRLDDVAVDGSVSAVDWMIRTLEEAAEPVVIVTLGALTNIADLLRARPDLKTKIAWISMMGGAFLKNLCEYNFACDPEAADYVLRSGVSIEAAGLDVTFQCLVPEDSLRELAQMEHPCIRLLMSMRRQWGGSVYLHDPLAVAMVFKKEYLHLKKAVYRVERRGEISRGMAVLLSDQNWQVDPSNSSLKIAADVDSAGFVEFCIGRLREFGR